MIVNMMVAHKAVLFSIYLILFLSTVVFIERFLYFTFTFPAEKKLIAKEAESGGESRAEAVYHTYVDKLRRGLGVISFSITAAPLLGLLGTVLGIMDSFMAMAEKGISDIALVSRGIAFALEATALGIVVAVASLIYFYVINGMASRAKTEIKKAILGALEIRKEE